MTSAVNLPLTSAPSYVLTVRTSEGPYRTPVDTLLNMLQVIGVIGVDTATDSISLDSTDRNRLKIVDSALAKTVTVPPDSEGGFEVGDAIMVCRAGAGSLTFVAGSGVVLKPAIDATLALRAQDSMAVLFNVSADTWRIAGDMDLA